MTASAAVRNVTDVAAAPGPATRRCHRRPRPIGHTGAMSVAPARRSSCAVVVLVALLVLAASATTGCSFFDKKIDVLYIGDSIMNQTGPFAEAYLVDQPGVGSAKTRVEGINGTGLLTPKLVDWQAKAKQLVDTYQPKVVVILFIGNYTDTDLWTGADGQPVPNDYGDRFFQEWGAQAEKLTATLSAKGAKVDWVLPPPLAGDEGGRREAGMRKTYEDLKGRVPAVELVDARLALGGPNGEWVWRRPGVDGGEVTVRQGDSVHLTEDGGRLMARQIAQQAGPQLQAIRAAQT